MTGRFLKMTAKDSNTKETLSITLCCVHEASSLQLSSSISKDPYN